MSIICAEGTEANPSSPYTRKRASSFLKSLKSKLSTHTEEEEEQEEEQSHMQAEEDVSQMRPRSKSATLQRSQSVRTRGSEKRQPASSNGTAGHLDLARSSSVDSTQQRSNSAGIKLLPRTSSGLPQKHHLTIIWDTFLFIIICMLRLISCATKNISNKEADEYFSIGNP